MSLPQPHPCSPHPRPPQIPHHIQVLPESAFTGHVSASSVKEPVGPALGLWVQGANTCRGCGYPVPSCEAASYGDCGTRTVMLASLPWLQPHLTMSTHDPSSHCPLPHHPHHSSHIRSLSHSSPLDPRPHPLAPADQDLSQGPDPLAKDLGASLTPGSSASCRAGALGLRPLSPSGPLGPARPLPKSQPLGQGHLLPGDLPRPAPSSTAQESALPLTTEPWGKGDEPLGPGAVHRGWREGRGWGRNRRSQRQVPEE